MFCIVNYSRFRTLIPWIRKIIVLILIAFLANHLTEFNNFPFHDSYTFPWFSILTTVILGSLVLIIAELAFLYFRKFIFAKAITTRVLTLFLLSVLGLITVMYIPCFYLVTWLHDSDQDLYYLLTGLSITLLMSCIAIILLYGKPVYDLYKVKTLSDKLTVQRGNRKTLLNYTDIAYFYSENKVVYAVQCNGQVLATDFTLSEIDSKTKNHHFLRANRQTLIHAQSVRKIQAIENGKLLVTLAPAIFNKESVEIVVSRYKKKAFNEWLEDS